MRHGRRASSSRPRQIKLPLDTRDKPKSRAGRKPTGSAGVHHVPRSTLDRRYPVHVTTRMLDVKKLRKGRCYRAVRRSLAEGCLRPRFRVVEFTVMHNHIHLICEAEDRPSLSRGLQGLFIRMAKALNRVLGRKGKVFADRYQDHVLRTPAEVRNALAYVLNNYRRHAQRWGRKMAGGWLDPCSSAPEFREWTGRTRAVWRHRWETPMPRARTWMLGEGWQRAGPILVNAVPGPG